MKLHIEIKQFEYAEVEVPDDISDEKLMEIYTRLHHFPERINKWKRPPEEHMTDTDKLAAL